MFGGSVPSAPQAPVNPPTVVDPSVQAGGTALRLSTAQAAGRASTILTSGTGAPALSTPLKRTLLGGG